MNSLYATTQTGVPPVPLPLSASMGVEGGGEGSGSEKIAETATRDAK